jgi:hypothetical protein
MNNIAAGKMLQEKSLIDGEFQKFGESVTGCFQQRRKWTNAKK